MTNTELIARLRSFETDHKPEGWPAIQMRDVSALLDAIEALEAEVERLKGLYESSTAAHEETVGRAMRAEAQLAAAQGQLQRAFNWFETIDKTACESEDSINKSRKLFAVARDARIAMAALKAAPIPQQPAEPTECCEHCDDGDGLCVFPMYGPAPHTHDTSSGWIGSTRTLPKEQWGNNFREDPDCKGHGVYMRCESCGRGEQQATAPSVPEGWKLVPIEATPEMIESGAAHQYGSSSSYQNNLDAENTWDSMLAAAPQPKEPATYTPPKIIDPDAPHP